LATPFSAVVATPTRLLAHEQMRIFRIAGRYSLVFLFVRLGQKALLKRLATPAQDIGSQELTKLACQIDHWHSLTSLFGWTGPWSRKQNREDTQSQSLRPPAVSVWPSPDAESPSGQGRSV